MTRHRNGIAKTVLACIATALLAACGTSQHGYDTSHLDHGWEDDTASPDSVLQDTAVPDTNQPRDNGADALVPHDESTTDQGTDDIGKVDTSTSDEGSGDTGRDSGTVTVDFCRTFADCEDDEVCDFSLGRCEKRDSWKTGVPALYDFHPPAGAAGDIVVIDGSVLHTTMVGGEFNTRADIGGTLVAGGTGNIGVDENRMVGMLKSSPKGKVRVVFGDNGGTRVFPVEFQSAPSGVIECDGTTPGRETAGDAPTTTGPYGAGYLDVATNYARVFYPAECGSVRRPGVPGTYPLLVILHGNGAVHINHEHLGQLLATWGVITVMPKTEMTNGYSDEAPAQIKATVQQFRGISNLGSIHPALEGLGTTSEIAFAGHSKGCYRMQEFLQENPTARSNTVGAIFLGPADFNYELPGGFLVFGGGEDGQSFESYVNAAYNRQASPKWKVWMDGANHGNFCDHKVYYSMDSQPTITRHQQLTVVETFAVPFIQKIFGLDEPFADWLANPPASSLYSVVKSL